MVKRTRADKRIATVTTEYGETQIAEERKAQAKQASDTDLFYIDSGDTGNKAKDKKARTKVSSTSLSHPLQYTLPSSYSSTAVSQNSSTSLGIIPTTVLSTEPVSKAKFLQRKPPKVFTHSTVEEKLIARVAQKSSLSTALTTTTATPSTIVSRPTKKEGEKEEEENSYDPWSKKEDTKRLTAVSIHEHQRRDVQRSQYLRNLPKLSSIFSTSTILSSASDPGGNGSSYNPEYTIHQQTIAKSVHVLQTIEQKKQNKKENGKLTDEPLQFDAHDPDDDDDENNDKDKEKTTTITTTTSGKPSSLTLPPSSTATKSTTNQPSTQGTVSTATKTNKKKLTKGEKRRAEKALFMQKLATAVQETQTVAVPSSSSSTQKSHASKIPTTLVSSSLPQEMIDNITIKQATIGVPLSEELTGSLRTLKPVTASTLLSTQLLNISSQGLAHPRNPRHATNQIVENEFGQDTIEVLTTRQLNRLKRKGNPWKEIEFPRRKEFEPAQEAVKQILNGSGKGNQKKGNTGGIRK